MKTNTILKQHLIGINVTLLATTLPRMFFVCLKTYLQEESTLASNQRSGNKNASTVFPLVSIYNQQKINYSSFTLLFSFYYKP